MANIQFKTAWDHIRRAPFQALAALFVLGTTFFVISILSILTYSSGKIIKYFETRPQIIAFLKDEVTESQVSELRQGIENDSRVKEVKYISKEEALEIYKKATASNPVLSELVSPSIFPASLELSVTDLSYAQVVIDEIKGSQYVDQVGFTASLGSEDNLGEVISRLRNITWYLRIGGGAFAILLTSTSFLVLIIIIGMRLTTRRGEIEILSLIGATPGFIRNPIILEALIYVFAGVFAGWFFALILVLYSTPSLINYFGEIPILPKNTMELISIFALIFCIEALIGVFLAFTGSILAVSRVKKKK